MEITDTITGEEIAVKQERQAGEFYELTFPRVAAFVRRMGGNFEDAKDIFQDALVLYYEIITRHRAEIRGPEEAYVLGIAKHLWARKHQQNRTEVAMSEFEREIPVPDEKTPTVEEKRLLRILENAGKKCMDLLRAFYHERRPVKNLAAMLGYTNEHAVSAQKYKCLEKIRSTIKQKSLHYDDFIE